MRITKLKLQNFKSFESAEIDLSYFTVIVGANASGKSNLISAYRFIKNCMTLGLDNAIALQGGIDNIINSRSQRDVPVTIEFEIDFTEECAILSVRKEKIALELQKLNYSFSMQPNKRGSGYRLVNDQLNIEYKCFEDHMSTHKKNDETRYKDLNVLYKTKYIRKTNNSKAIFQSDFEYLGEKPVYELKSIDDNFVGKFFAEMVSPNKKELMLFRLSMLLPPFFSEDDFINIYDFDPKMLKHSCSMTSIKKLEENGSNMAAVLQNLLKSKDKRKELTVLLNNTLPFITNIGIENNLDQSFSFKIKEEYSSKMFYANFLSDGTVSIIAIILALYFEKNAITIIFEEPERNIHPALLQKIVEMAKDVSSNKQVLFTTHNPEIIRNIPLESILFIKRDDFGNSTIVRPADSTTVACFIENELGLDELFVRNLLGE